MNLEGLGLVGVFLAGAIPWMEAIAVVPSGIVIGLDPTAVVLAAILGNATTIFLFAYLSSRIRQLMSNRRIAKGKSPESPKFIKAKDAFDKYGIFGMALLGPILIGTQFAAAASVAAGVRPIRAATIITLSMTLWAIFIAVVMVVTGISLDLI